MFDPRELMIIELALHNRKAFLEKKHVPLWEEKIEEIDALIKKIRDQEKK